jgi:uncharacterized membrane protein YkoI
MTPKKAIMISAVAVSLVLALSFGVIKVVAQINNQNSSDSSLTEQITQREDAYQKLVNEANQRIQDLNSQVVNQTPTLLTIDAALAIAYHTVGSEQALSDVPQLVNYQGATAYEIPFINGSMVIDAETGAVLSNSVRPVIDSQQAIEIAGAYLGVSNLSSARVTTITIDGTEVYQVTIANYVVFVDKFGTITKVQVLQYVAPSSSGGGGGSSRSSEREHEDDDDD